MKQTLRAIFIIMGAASLTLSAAGSSRVVKATATGYPPLVSGPIFSDAQQGIAQKSGDDINDVVFYPNPVKSDLTVLFPRKGNFSVTIYNIIGDKVLTKTVMDDNEIHLDVSDLQNGLYFISYEFGDKILTKRFSKIS